MALTRPTSSSLYYTDNSLRYPSRDYSNSNSGTGHLVRAMTSHLTHGRNVTLLYNDGEVVVPTNRTNGGNVAIYNGTGGRVYLQEDHTCAGCGESFNSRALKERHYRMYPFWCRVHGMCISSWQTHMDDYRHTQCGVRGCSRVGVDFGTNYAFKQHFWTYHYDQ